MLASVGRKSAAPSAIFRAGITAIRPSRRPVWENARKDGGRRCAFPPYLLLSLVWSWRYWDKGLRRPQPVSRGFLFAANIALVLGAHAAFAQSISAPQPAVHHLPAYCQRSTLTGVELLQSIHKIIVHGDLTDIKFLGKTFETKFKTSTGWNEDGTPDTQTIYYSSNEIFGSPADMEIDVWAKAMQGQMGIADLQIQGGHSPQAVNDVIGSCLHISAHEFAKSIGGRFYPLPAPPNPSQILQGTQQTIAQGKGATMLHVYVHYETDTGMIRSIQIVQRP